MPKKQPAKIFSKGRLLFYVLSAGIFYIALRETAKLKDMHRLLLEMNGTWLALAFAAQLATYIFNVLILDVLLKGRRGIAGFLALFKISVVILFINQALPTGGISGNGYLFGQLVKRKIAAADAYKALLLESICYYIAFLILLGVSYSWYAVHRITVNRVLTYTVLTGFLFFSALGGIMLTLANKRMIAFLLKKLSHFKWIRNYIAKNKLLSLEKGKIKSWKTLFGNKKPIAAAIVFQIAILSCDAVTLFAIMHSFHVSLSCNNILLGLMLSLVIGSLPISPGALIAYESAMTFFYSLLGVPMINFTSLACAEGMSNDAVPCITRV